MSVRRLTPDDLDAFMAIRREALTTAPLAFGSSPHEDRGLEPGTMRETLRGEAHHVVFGFFDAGVLLGVVGLRREAGQKSAHKAGIWGMYVTGAARGRGAGRALIEAAIAHARGWQGVEQVQLSVTTPSKAARQLYASLGFVSWGTEPRALLWEGRAVDEEYMTLTLDAGGPASA